MFFPVGVSGNRSQKKIDGQNEVTGCELRTMKCKTYPFQRISKTKPSKMTSKYEPVATLPTIHVCGSRKTRKTNRRSETLPLKIFNMNDYTAKVINTFHLPNINQHHQVKNDIQNSKFLMEWPLILSKSPGFKPIAFRSRPTFGELCLMLADELSIEDENITTDSDEFTISDAKPRPNARKRGKLAKVRHRRQVSVNDGNDVFTPEVLNFSLTENASPSVEKVDGFSHKLSSCRTALAPSSLSSLNVVPQIMGCKLHKSRSHHNSPRVLLKSGVPDVLSLSDTEFALASRTAVSNLSSVSGACAECPLCKAEAPMQSWYGERERSRKTESTTDSSTYHVTLPSTTTFELL